MVKAVIFDVDGTLVDSVDLHAQARRDAFLEFGHDVDVRAAPLAPGRPCSLFTEDGAASV